MPLIDKREILFEWDSGQNIGTQENILDQEHIDINDINSVVNDDDDVVHIENDTLEDNESIDDESTHSG